MDLKNFYKHECRTFIAAYDLLLEEGRLDMLSVKVTIMYGLKKRALKEGLDEDMLHAMSVTSTYDDITYN